jgi:hypothetical protein
MDIGLVECVLCYSKGSDPYLAGVEKFLEFAFKDKPEGIKFIVHVRHVCTLLFKQGMTCMGIWCAMGYLRIMMNGIFMVMFQCNTQVVQNQIRILTKGMFMLTS